MKFVVVLMALAAICYADDDDSDEVSSSEVYSVPLIPQVKTIAHPAISLPAHVPVVKTLPAPTFKTAETIVHGHSASPAVMKIPKPGVRFEIPTAAAVHIPSPAVVPAPALAAAPAVMPKTTLRVETPAPAPAVTLKAAEAPAAVSTTSFASNLFQLPYYSTAMSFGVPLPGLAQQTVAAVPSTSVPVAATTPIQYSSLPTAGVGLPITATHFQTPQAMTYWSDLRTPEQMTNFLNLRTGGFSYVNVLGDVSRDTPLIVASPFKAIQSLFPSFAGLKDTAAVISA